MTLRLFNRTIFLWASAMAVAALIVNPRAALFQRINTINQGNIDCVVSENCEDGRSIAEAREYYMILAQLYPGYGRGSEMEGICYVLLKQDKLAIKKFQEAIKHNPNLFWVSFELGKAYYRQGEYARALNYFQTITTQDNDTLLKKATLSTLRPLPDKTKEVLMFGLVDFVTDIKLKSYQLAIGCLMHQGNWPQAKSVVKLELNSPEMWQNDFFVLANRSLGDDDAKKEMLSWIDALAYSKPVIHPWGHVIPPVKEILYQ